MAQSKSHALLFLALLAASGPAAAFQAPNVPLKKISLDVSFVERTQESLPTLVKDVVEKKTVEKNYSDGGLKGKSDLEERLRHGAAFHSTSMQKTAKVMLATAKVTEEPPAAVLQKPPATKVAEKPLTTTALQATAANVATKPTTTALTATATTADIAQSSSTSEVLAGLDLSKISNVLTPTEAFDALVQKGQSCATSNPEKILFSSALGGCYVGMGAMVSLAVAGNSPDLAAADPGLQKFIFAALFPMNLLLSQQAGGMLYTGNTASMMAAVCEKRANFGDMGRVLALSWMGNLFGCAVFALSCKYAGVMEGGAAVLAAKTLAAKTSTDLGPVFVKAVFCNWLVCLAVLLSTQAKDMGGKYISIWLPVSTFVSIGFEHSVANMFLLPAGLMSQDEITFGTALVKNLIPVTIGNAFSGSLLVGATMSYLYGSLGKPETKVETKA
eukprot:scaffold4503_cov167-Amphora_coffeaeformis.AAC.13